MSKIDDIDKQILAFLHEDAYMSNKDMAQRLGMSPTPIHERIKRMEKDGVITGYKATINPNKLGKSLTVFCDISLKEHAAEYLKQFEEDVMNLLEVQECYCVSGHSDFLLKIVVADMDEYRDFILHKLASIKNIGNAQSHFVMNQIQNESILPWLNQEKTS
ncbi:Lrp/AsnC family transcriptional regulator [Cytophagaceae bacterium 50C-KIRBA]|uniref:Lrp/AsnC family transcriptional regulator n=1 Tax=Aquirufa beregesia TaxID=2516556 RepID=A0ABX0F224_9BACT|nr:Lrp/AsnC family transcriptional regulator [Aquirufa beregesia]NGZ43905.1 Lrp/AsnC family transcriptional regulator [Aquirufa beregesia]